MPAKRSGGSGGAASRGNWVDPSTAPGASASAHTRPSADTSKKLPETEAILAHRADKAGKPLAETASDQAGPVKRLRMDGNATVKMGAYARGGKPRGDYRAVDPTMGDNGKYVPFGRIDKDSGPLPVTWGSSSTTRDVMVDSLQAWWTDTPLAERATIAPLHLKGDNGPASSGGRPQFLTRLVDVADHTGKPIQVLDYPPQHSNYQPLERGWGSLEQQGNGTTRVEIDTMLGWDIV